MTPDHAEPFVQARALEGEHLDGLRVTVGEVHPIDGRHRTRAVQQNREVGTRVGTGRREANRRFEQDRQQRQNPQGAQNQQHRDSGRGERVVDGCVEDADGRYDRCPHQAHPRPARGHAQHQQRRCAGDNPQRDSAARRRRPPPPARRHTHPIGHQDKHYRSQKRQQQRRPAARALKLNGDVRHRRLNVGLVSRFGKHAAPNAPLRPVFPLTSTPIPDPTI